MEEGGYGYYIDISDPSDVPFIKEYINPISSSEFYYNTRKNIHNGITYSNSYVYSNPYESYNSIPSKDTNDDIETNVYTNNNINHNNNCNLIYVTDIAAKTGFVMWLVYLILL